MAALSRVPDADAPGGAGIGVAASGTAGVSGAAEVAGAAGVSGADAGGPPPAADLAPDARLRALHEAHAEPLFRFLLRLAVGERQLAEDLLQETMMRAWRSIDSLATDPETQRRWLFTVARRVAIDMARARQARPTEVGSLDLSRMPATADEAERVVTAQTVREALPKISAEHRRVVEAVYFRGLSTAEIAAAFGIAEGTVKSRAHYALRALRAVIGEVDGV
ncbi:sigma-70 family RNA polymerase sigma factor [Micromonospora sp. WMMD714]|uniref:sigma-70 family RNA polymerase sigma factor n=1 Tax=Micromonospora sp. WMMD714 TaxID=3016097 RepID=UPI00249B8F23|nr:sigma-70 family RNA polymerase sigma factor [Micromonospora sp. WMMD714]WFE65282.1 sigma-70 family RNA polymerase sigma factor [Micromonospora sp. WMMD714]